MLFLQDEVEQFTALAISSENVKDNLTQLQGNKLTAIPISHEV